MTITLEMEVEASPLTRLERAGASNDYRTYYLLAEELGLKLGQLQYPDVYQAGKIVYSKIPANWLSRTARRNLADVAAANATRVKTYDGKPRKNPRAYAEFHAKALQLCPSEFKLNPQKKMELLVESFPNQFGEKGRYPISRCKDDPEKLGAIFNHIVLYSARFVPQSRAGYRR
jgi:hypothetical protein